MEGNGEADAAPGEPDLTPLSDAASGLPCGPGSEETWRPGGERAREAEAPRGQVLAPVPSARPREGTALTPKALPEVAEVTSTLLFQAFCPPSEIVRILEHSSDGLRCHRKGLPCGGRDLCVSPPLSRRPRQAPRLLEPLCPPGCCMGPFPAGSSPRAHGARLLRVPVRASAVGVGALCCGRSTALPGTLKCIGFSVSITG